MTERAPASSAPPPPSPEGTDDARFLAGWDETLDALSYYAILGIDDGASKEAVTDAFHRFCATFHPDLHSARSPAELRTVSRIFARGAEAYRVLVSPQDREGYDTSLASSDVRPRRFSSMRPPPVESATNASAPPPLAAVAAAARPFAARAQEMILRGEYGAAKLHVELALVKDPSSPSLQALDAWLGQKLVAARE